MFSCQEFLDALIDRKLAMFPDTANEGGPSACQGRPEAFRVMRARAHCVRGEASLRSYLADLEQAGKSGRNRMIEKYARLDNRLPRLSAHPLLDEVADAKAAWLEKAAARFPHRIRPESHNGFRRYLAAGRNLVAERHDWLCRRPGYAPAEAEERAMAAGKERS